MLWKPELQTTEMSEKLFISDSTNVALRCPPNVKIEGTKASVLELLQRRRFPVLSLVSVPFGILTSALPEG